MRKLLVTVGLMLAVGMTVAVAGMGPLPNPLPKESKAVEKDGLSLAVRLPRTEWRADEPLEFTIVLKNVSDKPLLLWAADSQYAYHIVVQEHSADRDAGWTPEWRIEIDGLPGAKSQTLEPGQSLEVPVSLKGHRWQYAAKTKVPVKPRDRLDPGMWTLQVTRDFMAVPAAKGGQAAPYWQGRIASMELVFRVDARPAGARAPAMPPDHGNAVPGTGADKRATVVAEATDPTTGISVAIPRPGTVEATQDGKRVWSVTVPNECTKIRIVGREVHVSPSDRTFDLQSGKLLNIGTQGRIISFQPAAPASPAATSGAVAAPAVPPPFVEPALEIRLKADDPKLHLKGMAGVLALQKDRRVDYSVSGKMLTQFWLDEKQVQDFLAALKAAGLPVEGKLDLDPVDDRAPAFQKILQMWVLCAAPDRGRDVEAEREKQRLAAEADRIEREKRLAKLREMPTNAIPVGEVRKWPEYAAAAVIDPYAGQPTFRETDKETIPRRMADALATVIGSVSKVTATNWAFVSSPVGVPFDQWERRMGWVFEGADGGAEVWVSPVGRLYAHLKMAERNNGDGGKAQTAVTREQTDVFVERIHRLIEALWQGKLPEHPDNGSGGHLAWGTFAADTMSAQQLKERVNAGYRTRSGPPTTSASGKFGLETFLLDEIFIACGMGPEQFARDLAKKQAPLTERQAIARLACAIRNAAAGTELAEIAGKDGARVRKATRSANTWSLTVTTPCSVTNEVTTRGSSPPFKIATSKQILDSALVRSCSVDAHTGETKAGGCYQLTEEMFRQSQSPDRNLALTEVTAWPEYAAAQRDAEDTIRKQRQEHETKAAKIKAAYDKWWPEAKAKAAKALAAVRPDQAALAETFYMDAGTLWYPKKRPYGEYAVLRADDPTLVETIRQYGYNVADPEKWGITVAWGLRKQGIQNEPAGRIHFSHGPDGLRLRSLNITVPRAASDPAGKDREAWRKFALEGFRKLWGREPAGELQPEPPERTEAYSGKTDKRRIRNPEQHRLVWMPMWKGVPLSEGLGAVFEVVPAEGALSMSWSMADEAGAETRKVLASLDAYPLSHSEREAIAVVVKNMPVLAPDLPMEKAWVLPPAWSVTNPKSMLSYAPYQLYTDEAALRALLPNDDSGGVAVLTPARQVTVDTGEKDPRLLIGQVDPASGRVLQATQDRPWAQRRVE